MLPFQRTFTIFVSYGNAGHTTNGNKNYMSIGVSVRTTKFAARNSGIGVRQESNPQSPTAYSSVRYWQCEGFANRLTNKA